MVGDEASGALASDSTYQEPRTVVVGPLDPLDPWAGAAVVGGLDGLGRSRVAARPGVVAARVMTLSVCWLAASFMSALARLAWAEAASAAAA